MIASDPGFFFVDMIDTGTDIKLDNLEVVMLDAKTNCAIREANATLVPATLKRLFVEAV
jgi:hypothetical protein